jgi:poly(hydroxyalkanoate) depolymerase family esterase
MNDWREWLYSVPTLEARASNGQHAPRTYQEPLSPVSPLPLEQVSFDGPLGTMTARRFVPQDHDGAAGLILMLHGCGQSAEDFAAATAMAEHAEMAGHIVLYPAQSTTRSPSRCWNWFDPAHQQRGAGEPALLVDAVQQTMAFYDVDPRRVYVAGLSAGGAMAVTLGSTYPDVFAAVGSHSGLAHRSATGPYAALDVMRRGPGAGLASRRPGVPTIVFHGTADDTVHPSNGSRILSDCTGSVVPIAARTHDNRRRPRPFARTVYNDARGRNQAEYWQVSGVGHAWSGGRPEGTFADPNGPDASREMLRFFRSHVLRPRLATNSANG